MLDWPDQSLCQVILRNPVIHLGDHTFIHVDIGGDIITD